MLDFAFTVAGTSVLNHIYKCT